MLYTPVKHDQCYPVEDHVARSTDNISWGPHNILHVSTRWSVKLFTSRLEFPAHEIIVRHHPLCHRTDTETADVVIGAKWSAQLLAEGHYPACARLCVSTTGNLLVYRVTRLGTGGVQVSQGIGIALNCHSSELEDRTNRPSIPIVAEKPAPKKAAPKRAAATRKPAAKRTAKTVKKKRGRKARVSSSSSESCESESGDDSDDDDSSSSDSDDSSSSGSRSPKRKRAKCSPAASCTEKALTPGGKLPAAKAPGGKLPAGKIPGGKLPTGKVPGGKLRLSSTLLDKWMVKVKQEDELEEENAETELLLGKAKPKDVIPPTLPEQPPALPSPPPKLSPPPPPAPQRVPVPVAAPVQTDPKKVLGRQRFQLVGYFWLPEDALVVITTAGVHVVNFKDNDSDSEAAQVIPLPAPRHTFADDDLGVSHAMPCAAAQVHCNASLAHQLGESGVADAVSSGLIVVASPFIMRVMLVTTAQVRLVQYVEVPVLSSIPSSLCAMLAAGDQQHGRPTELSVVLFVSASSTTWRGSFPLDMHAAANTLSQSGLTCESKPQPWTTQVTYANDGASDDDYGVLGFTVISLASLFPASTHGAAPYVVLGVSYHCLYGFLLESPRALPLLRCPLLAAASELPEDAAVSVRGAAVHPSCALSLVTLQTGRQNHDPSHILPVSANDAGSFLSRLLDHHGVFGHVGSVGNQQQQQRTSQPSRLDMLRSLWQHQQSISFFSWERLHPRSADSHYLRPYLDAMSQLSVSGSQVDPSSGAALNDFGITVQSLRNGYLQLREEQGVSLFLRSVMPEDLSAEHPYQNLLQGNWWSQLLSLWRRCPTDPTPLYECILANAILTVARYAKYANVALAPGDSFWMAGSGSATTPHTYSYHGALQYISGYIEEQEHTLQAVQNRSSNAENETAVLTAPWCCSAEWVEALKTFLSLTAAASDLACQHLFPCSVCDAPNAAQFKLSMTCTTEHVPPLAAHRTPEKHTTVFSGRSFCSLSSFSDSGVLTRCLGCNCCDFATGPLCRVCGGLLQ